MHSGVRTLCSHMPLLVLPAWILSSDKNRRMKMPECALPVVNAGVVSLGFHEYCPAKHVRTAFCDICGYKSVSEADLWYFTLGVA